MAQIVIFCFSKLVSFSPMHQMKENKKYQGKDYFGKKGTNMTWNDILYCTFFNHPLALDG